MFEGLRAVFGFDIYRRQRVPTLGFRAGWSPRGLRVLPRCVLESE